MDSAHTVVPAVVLAGAPAEQDLKDKYSVHNRAEVPIHGKKMIQYVLDALHGSPSVGNICVVGDLACEGVAQIVPSAGSLIDNLIAGVKACDAGDGHVLIVTSDIPMVTSEAIEDFLARCRETEAEFYYAVISKEVNEAKYPGMARTYMKLAEGVFTGGNIILVSSRLITENGDLIRELLAARKKPVQMAGIIGMRFLFRAVIAQTIWRGALPFAFAEQTVGRIVKARLKAIRTPYAEIGADVDKLEHVEFAEKALSVK